MDDRLELGYGSDRVILPWDEVDLLQVLRPRSMPAPSEPSKAVEQALESPEDSAPLEERVRSGRSAVILVSGRDRVTRADLFMPPILRTLARAGIPRERVRIIVATATHLPFTAADLERVAGLSRQDGVCVAGHDCHDPAGLREMGRTSFDNVVRLNRAACEADVKILTGRITHHYFAGFTGGRKAVLPGIAAFETITHNHKLVMSGNGTRPVHPGARNGCLDRNPVHLDMAEGARMFQPTFLVNTVLDPSHALVRVVAGDVFSAHRTGCRFVEEHFRLRLPTPAEFVVASCGGDPYDVSFMQALKTLFNCHAAVADGGVLLLLAACPEGIKKGFLRWTEFTGLEALAAGVRRDYDLTGHNSYLLREVLRRIRVVLVSRCPGVDVARMGFTPAGEVAQGWRLALAKVERAAPRTYAIPHGNVTVLTGEGHEY